MPNEVKTFVRPDITAACVGEAVAINISGEGAEQLRVILNRALNTWPEGPQDFFALSEFLDNHARGTN